MPEICGDRLDLTRTLSVSANDQEGCEPERQLVDLTDAVASKIEFVEFAGRWQT